jgi:tetrahydromethanopterin S-methyltransferase subunit C
VPPAALRQLAATVAGGLASQSVARRHSNWAGLTPMLAVVYLFSLGQPRVDRTTCVFAVFTTFVLVAAVAWGAEAVRRRNPRELTASRR